MAVSSQGPFGKVGQKRVVASDSCSQGPLTGGAAVAE